MNGSPFIFPNDIRPAWSIMIVLYPYITGVVGGTFVVASLYHVFHRDTLKPVSRLALVTSLCFGAFAAVPLLLHLKHPERCFQVMITPSVTSAIAGFGFIYGTYMLVLITEVWLVYRESIVEQANCRRGMSRSFYRIMALGVTEITPRARAVDQWLIRVLAIIGIPIACVLTGYVGFMFGSIKANPWWSTSLMPVIFLLSAILSGSAALVVLHLFISWWRGESPDADCVRELSRYLWIFLLLTVSLEGLELLQMAYEAGGEWHVVSALLTKHLAVSYGLVQVVIGSVVPLFLLLPSLHARTCPRMMTRLSGLSSVLVLVQVFSMRWNIVVGGQLFSKSFRGFVEFPVHWAGREGLIAATAVLALPLLAIWIVSKIVSL